MVVASRMKIDRQMSDVFFEAIDFNRRWRGVASPSKGLCYRPCASG